MRLPVRKMITGVLMIGLSPVVASAALPTKTYLPLELATAAAQAAIDRCKVDGLSVSVVVVDRGGEIIMAMRGDDGKPHHFASALRKAYTARTFEMPSGFLQPFIASHPEAAGLLEIDGVIALGGGMPIKVGDDTVAAIGVAGASSSGEDEVCTQAGIAAIADRLE